MATSADRRVRRNRRTLAQLVTAVAFSLSMATAPVASQPTSAPQSPADLFDDLYRDAALAGIFPDGKTLADITPRQSPARILEAYRTERPKGREALRAFYDKHFMVGEQSNSRQPQPRLPLRDHIDRLWPLLTRHADTSAPHSSRLPLPNPYIVPGGRFTEIYYWDSYFTMLGFGPQQAGIQRHMVDNFAYLIKTYGHIPNGNRTYYLSRSQPPFFFKMVELTRPDAPAAAFATYLDALRAEYAFWMRGAEALAAGEAEARVVRMADGALLNRYWDNRDTPRDEAYAADIAAAETSGRARQLVYRDLRAAAESGWDFSSRWMGGGSGLGATRTTDIVPVDLNSLLYGLENAIAQGCGHRRDIRCERDFRRKAQARRNAVRAHLWNGSTGMFDDYIWSERRFAGNISAAALYPLFFGIASRPQAAGVAAMVERELLKPGGLVTTPVTSGQQWDAPNGWAPLQWIAVNGLRDYGHDSLAETIARRWLKTVTSVFAHTDKLLEKYDVVTVQPGGGGEYPLQDGFGWTNGVTIGLMELYPSWAIEHHSSINN